MRRHYNQSSYLFNNYLVTIEAIHNSASGCPRYKAIITNIEGMNSNARLAAVYTFNGHYYNEKEEARFILNEDLKEYAEDFIKRLGNVFKGQENKVCANKETLYDIKEKYIEKEVR